MDTKDLKPGVTYIIVFGKDNAPICKEGGLIKKARCTFVEILSVHWGTFSTNEDWGWKSNSPKLSPEKRYWHVNLAQDTVIDARKVALDEEAEELFK